MLALGGRFERLGIEIDALPERRYDAFEGFCSTGQVLTIPVATLRQGVVTGIGAGVGWAF